MKVLSFNFERDYSNLNGFTNGRLTSSGEIAEIRFQHLQGYNVTMILDTAGYGFNGININNGKCFLNICTPDNLINLEAMEFIKSRENDCKEITDFLIQHGVKSSEQKSSSYLDESVQKEQAQKAFLKKQDLDKQKILQQLGCQLKEQQQQLANEQRELEKLLKEQQQHLEKQQLKLAHQEAEIRLQTIGEHDKVIKDVTLQGVAIDGFDRLKAFDKPTYSGTTARNTMTADEVVKWVKEKLFPNGKDVISIGYTKLCSPKGDIDITIGRMMGKDKDGIEHTYNNIHVKKDAYKPLSNDSLTFSDDLAETNTNNEFCAVKFSL